MKKQILLVDDKPTIAKIITYYLSENCDIIYKENPIEAFEWLKERNTLDLIITDINMPIMRGDEFLQRLKSDEQLKAIPVIVLSSEDKANERIKMFEYGAEDYIVKPFNPVEIKVRVFKILSLL